MLPYWKIGHTLHVCIYSNLHMDIFVCFLFCSLSWFLLIANRWQSSKQTEEEKKSHIKLGKQNTTAMERKGTHNNRFHRLCCCFCCLWNLIFSAAVSHHSICFVKFELVKGRRVVFAFFPHIFLFSVWLVTASNIGGYLSFLFYFVFSLSFSSAH